ncbi:MAG: RNA polymerase subunit sigma [Planctomycetes bacterium]|nr:RNA polymerase subunit sigma [Planctomycetota bacterium]
MPDGQPGAVLTAASPAAALAAATGQQSSSELLQLVYHQLRKLAADRLKRERRGHTLTPTALVHEAYLKLIGRQRSAARNGAVTEGGQPDEPARAGPPRWSGSGPFLAAASEAMRRILVDVARRKRAGKRGGDRLREDLHEGHLVEPARPIDLLALDEALRDFETLSPPKALLVKLLYFSGLSIPEAADALGVSRATAERWWAYSRAWLYDRMHDPQAPTQRISDPA